MQNNEITASSILSLFETTKEQRRSFTQQIVDGVVNGNLNPLNVHLQIKAMEELCKNIWDSVEYKEVVISEASKHKGGQKYLGNVISVAEAGVKSDYSSCGDDVINDLLNQKALLDVKIKERETFLKAVPTEGMDILDAETGNVTRIYPPTKTSTTTVKVTLK